MSKGIEKQSKDAKENKGGVDNKGITAKKDENFSEWFTQLIQKAELIEYSPVSGCYILRPNSYFIWEQVQQYFDSLIKADGVKNCYFPLFIPESLLTKEKEHVEGFAPEVAWVDFGGDTKLGERLAVRPTSETIMYDAYSKWIRSYQDLPLKLNQWANVVRWEFKHCTPFLRSREFLWQEGHNAFATSKEVEEDTLKHLDFYEAVFKDIYAIPVLKGMKSEGEKFAGAVYTLSVEAVLPNGERKAIQGATSHNLGQNFAKAFDIKFKDQNQEDQFVWQNSWGISTRSIGVMILQHSDDKGLVLPPRVAPVQVVLVPIVFDKGKEEVLTAVHAVNKLLVKSELRTHVDDREGYTAGWKFNEWEVKGVPIRIEIGPKDLEKKQAVLVRRDTGKKEFVPLDKLGKTVAEMLETIQSDLYARAKELMEKSIVTVDTLEEAKKQIEGKKIIFAKWCGREACEDKTKEALGGAKSLNAPLDQPPLKGAKCFSCKEKATKQFYFGKSY